MSDFIPPAFSFSTMNIDGMEDASDLVGFCMGLSTTQTAGESSAEVGVQEQVPNSSHVHENEFACPLEDGIQPQIEIQNEFINPSDATHYGDIVNNINPDRRSCDDNGMCVPSSGSAPADAILRTKILPQLRDDHIAHLIRFDWLITIYGIRLTTEYPHSIEMIRSQLRLAGRQLYIVQQIRPEVIDLASIYEPKYYDSLITAIRIIGNFSIATNLYGSPSTAAAAAMQIKVIGSLLICEFMKQENVEKQTRTEDFLKFLSYDNIFDELGKMAQRKDQIDPTIADAVNFVGGAKNPTDDEAVEKKKREKWSTMEISMVKEAFSTYLLSKTLPSEKAIREIQAQEKYRELRTRRANNIRTWIWIYNEKTA